MQLSTEAARSLKAVSAWVDVIEANISGTQRVAYKASSTRFQPTSAVVANNADKINIPTAQLVVSENWINFNQGDIMGTSSVMDLAIQGRGYFLVSDTLDPATRKVFLTRDGEFHWGSEGRLLTTTGLYVLDSRAVANFQDSNEAIPLLTDSVTGGVFKNKDTLHLRNPSQVAVLPQYARIDVEYDLTKYIAVGNLQADLDDLRVSYWDGGAHVVLAIQVDTTLGLDRAIISFRNPAGLPPNQLQDRLFLNYGNVSVGPGPLTTFGPMANFADDFNDAANSAIPPARTNWQLPTGSPATWVVRDAGKGPSGDGDTDRELIQTFNTVGDSNIVVNDGTSLTWNDYNFSLSYGNQSPDDDASYVYMRYQDDNNYYRLVQHTGGMAGFTRRIERRVAGVTTVLAGDNYLPAGATTFPSPTWRQQVNGEVVGNTIRISGGGAPPLLAVDTTSNPILSGTFGVGVVSQQTWFDDIRVTPFRTPNAVRASENGVIVTTGLGDTVDLTNISWDQFIRDTVALAQPSNEHGLMYSSYGSTVFENSHTSNGRIGISSGQDERYGMIKTKALEMSNSQFTEYIPLLAITQRMFAAISKIIAIYNMTLDDLNAGIR